MIDSVLLTVSDSIGMNNSACYVIGTIIALLLLGYLLFSLVKPEKF